MTRDTGAESGTRASCLTTFGLARTQYRPDIREIRNQIDQMTVMSGNKYKKTRRSVTVVRAEDGGHYQLP